MLTPGRVARNQGAGDAEVGALAHETLGIEQAKGQSNHRGNGRQCDVALREIQPDTHDFRTLPQAPANDARVGYGGGVGTRARSREGETRHFLAAREARQEMIFLRLGSVVQQQFRGSQRVRYRNGRGGRARARGDLDQHARMRIGREFQPAVAPRNDHGEEAVGLDEGPHFGRQVGPDVRDVPVIEHGAQVFARSVEKCLFRFRQCRYLRRHQLLPVRPAREQFSVPPHRAGIQALRVRWPTSAATFCGSCARRAASPDARRSGRAFNSSSRAYGTEMTMFHHSAPEPKAQYERSKKPSTAELTQRLARR